MAVLALEPDRMEVVGLGHRLLVPVRENGHR